MQLAPEITIRDLPRSQAIESDIRKKIEKLNQFYDQIIQCQVTIEQTQKHKHRGKIYNTRIRLTVPGEELTANRAQNEDVYVATRDAFRAITRQLRSFNQKQRRAIKKHPVPLHGEVSRIFPEDGYGFIRCNGDEYFFSFTNIAYPSFEEIDIGSKVQFLPTDGDDGLRAERISTGKHKPLIED